MIYTVYEVDSGTEYCFNANSPFNAMEKMLYTRNISQQDINAEIKKTKHGYLLTHGSKEFWTRKQV
jgi:hypothetical protein